VTISEAARASGVSVHTLRYYEQEGLIHRVDRASSGHRRYSDHDVDWVVFLTRLRETGMPIRQMRQYAELVRDGDSTEAARLALLQAHGAAVRARMSELEDNLEVIERKIEMYRERGGKLVAVN
jgi:DNA-binding transcriptional MerR regulator